MTVEGKLKAEIKRWLKSKGAYVFSLQAGPGVPTAAPDICFLYKDKWGVIEGKKSATAPFRPGQQATLDFLKQGNEYVYVAYPENWLFIKNNLDAKFFL